MESQNDLQLNHVTNHYTTRCKTSQTNRNKNEFYVMKMKYKKIVGHIFPLNRLHNMIMYLKLNQFTKTKKTVAKIIGLKMEAQSEKIFS